MKKKTKRVVLTAAVATILPIHDYAQYISKPEMFRSNPHWCDYGKRRKKGKNKSY